MSDRVHTFEALDDGAFQISLPPPGKGPTFFIVGLHKAGSTMLNGLFKPLARQAGYTFFSLPNTLHALGMRLEEFRGDLSDFYGPEGYAFGGFRNLTPSVALPAYARGRTLFLVRDPRDMITSHYFSVAFSHRAPGSSVSSAALTAFAQGRERALAGTIDAFVLEEAPEVLRKFTTTTALLEPVEPTIYRYEDVIFDKPAWVADMIGRLGLSLRPNVVARIIARVDQRPDVEDPMKHVRRVAPGDHREKLAPATIEALNEVFAPILDRFGYR